VVLSRFEYQDNPSGFPLLRREDVETSGYETGLHQIVNDYETTLSAVISDEEFTLAAFGISEPALPGGTRSSRFGWLLLLGALPLVAAAMWLRRVARGAESRRLGARRL
jgi:hypothetical protein